MEHRRRLDVILGHILQPLVYVRLLPSGRIRADSIALAKALPPTSHSAVSALVVFACRPLSGL